MIDVVFLYRAGHVNSGAKIMRCDQLCAMAQERLGGQYRFSTLALPRPGHVGRQRKLPEALRGAVVIFLKRADRALDPEVLAELRQKVRAMCLDFVDARMLPVPSVPMDVMIAASHSGLLAIEWDLAPQMDTAPVARLVMHHHDPSLRWIDRSADTWARVGYFGLKENAYLPDAVVGDIQFPDYEGSHVDPQSIAALRLVNTHYAVREVPERNRLLEFKPFTKGFNAAASGAVVLVNRQVPDAVELLGEDYPFLIDAPTVEAVQGGFARLREAAGGPDWARALEAMATLRDASSAETVTRQLGDVLAVALGGGDLPEAPVLFDDDLEASAAEDPEAPLSVTSDVGGLAPAPMEDALAVPTLEMEVFSAAPSGLTQLTADALPEIEAAPAPPEFMSAPPGWDVDVGPEDRVLFVGEGWVPEGLSEEAVLALDGSEDPEEVQDFAPTVVVCHWLDLSVAVLEHVDLGVVHTVALGPRVEGILLETVLVEAGLRPVAPRVFRRLGQGLEVGPMVFESRMPMRAYRRWGQSDPRVLIATCMKDEGPFVLEWIAWHQALGVSDFIVFSNDCSDGTDDILNRLDAMGVVTHLNNPAVREGSTYFQPVALKHLHGMPGFAHADFVISMDVDEFINIHAGDGHLNDLLGQLEPFDALSMSELNHGSNGREEFEPGWVTEQFPAHQVRDPGKWKAARGVKTITRLSPKIMQVRNHRPDFAEGAPVVWLNGSGHPVDALQADPKLNGLDCRGAYGLVTLEHYPLRSAQSYLVKKHRGDVVIEGKSVGQRYWRLRDRNEVMPDAEMRNAAAARTAYGALLQDPELAAVHMAACKKHADRINEVAQLPEFQELRAWITAQSMIES